MAKKQDEYPFRKAKLKIRKDVAKEIGNIPHAVAFYNDGGIMSP
jgi:hypothetical protein